MEPYSRRLPHVYPDGELRAWVVMPNHVHVLWQPQVEMPVITRWVNGATARAANLLLGRTGQVFWQDES